MTDQIEPALSVCVCVCPSEGEKADSVSLQPADPETDFFQREETRQQPRLDGQDGETQMFY